jgi:hypothetical protein
MTLPDKFIVFLGRTFRGHHHDYSMLKAEFPPELDWFADLHVRVDLGYLGIKTDYSGDRIDIPTKKPRKSKKNPMPQLSDEQKAANTALSQIRILIGCKSPHKHLRVKQLSEGWRLDELVSLLPPLIPLSVRHPLGRFGS